jgi:hypothetical protein
MTGKKGRPLAPCGTDAAYQRHRKLGQDCSMCRKAAADKKRALYIAKPKTPKLLPLAVRNRETVREEKLRRGACMDCGLVIDERTIVCIDFDHRDPQIKSFQISDMIGRVKCSVLIEEMAKCDAVCRNCHALRTHDKQHHLVSRDITCTAPTLFD